MPRSFRSFIWWTSGHHQIWLAVMSAIVFGLTTVPLEIQRRVVNDAFRGGQFSTILLLAGIYLAVSLVSGLTKLALNVYRNWVGENVVRDLRTSVDQKIRIDTSQRKAAETEGVEISLIVAESEPVGQFVGSAVAEPMLQGGILLSVLGYMVYLQPIIALVVLAVLSPQFVFVPLMQRAINKRATARIVILRGVSVAIVEHPAAFCDRKQRQRFDTAFELNMGIYKLKFSMNFLMNFMRQLGICGILALGGWFVINGRTEIGTVVAFISGLAEINDPWGDLVAWFRDMRVVNAKYQLIFDAVKDLAQPAPQEEPR
ncbi:ABC transporter transmembrane region [Rhizobiales bacterium GAS113]|nr:ABC transporter transmembrane region [Rhizobiales bacterium GAS113]